MSWLYNILSVRALSAPLGSLQIVPALLIALRPFRPGYQPSAARWAWSAVSVRELPVTTPGVTAAGGFPVLSALPGQALFKDVVYLGAAALWRLGNWLGAARWQRQSTGQISVDHPVDPGRSR
jgi:hypothetical protein